MLQQSAPNRHDLMNVLSAIRGYGEMLREDLATEHAELDSALTPATERHSGG